MIIAGIDPGYERLGIAILEKNRGREKLLFSACLTTSAKLLFPKRLKIIGQEIERILNRFPVEAVALETLFLTKNHKTATKISEVRGMIIYLAAKRDLKIFEYSPMEIKMTITGFGQAGKNQIINMIKKLILPPTKKAQDDEFDAIAIGLTCLTREKI